MKTSNFLKASFDGGLTNAAATESEVITRKRRDTPNPVSAGLSGVSTLRGVAARIATINRADRRASEAVYRKTGGETLRVMRVFENALADEIIINSLQPRLVKRLHLDVLQPAVQPKTDAIILTTSGASWSYIRTTLEEWAALDQGWDGEEAEPVSDELLNVALGFVEVAENYDIGEPRPFIASDGEIGFIWDGAKKASVSFGNNDRFLAFCPRDGQSDLRLAGPLDVALCSPSLFESLHAHTIS